MGKECEGSNFYSELIKFQVTHWGVSGFVGITTGSAVGMVLLWNGQLNIVVI